MKDSEQIKTEKNDWLARQDSLAEKAALSVLLVEGHQPPALAVSNNNSICRVVQSSETHAERCEPYCGSAFAKAMEQGKPIQYRCHAGLYCVATPLPAEGPLVAITGRAFVQTSDYRELTERVYAGDWQNLPEDELFENVILAGSVEDIEQLSARLQNLNDDERAALEEIAGKPVGEVVEENAVLEDNDLHKEIEHLPETTKHFLESAQEEEVYPEVTPEIKLSTESDNLLEIGEEKPPSPKEIKVDAAEAPVRDEIQPEILKFEDSAETDLPELVANGAMTNPVEWQQFTENLLQSNYQTAVGDSLEFLATQCNFDSLGWLERSENSLKAAIVTGNLRQQTVKINLPQNEEMMREAARNETSLPLERKSTGVRQTIELFPLIFDEEIRAAIIVGEALASDEVRRKVARFCLQLALPLEFLRLREEIGKRARLQSALRKFNETLQAADSENYLETLMVNSAELVGSQRSSLLIYDESEKTLRAVAALGARAEEIKASGEIGGRVALKVWQNAKPVLVSNVENAGLPLAPVEYDYHSVSFISLPLAVGNRPVGVLNVTEKKGGLPFDESDLQLLESIAPQLAIALDRAALRQKAGEFEIASITDGLTDLLNRRYLEERLAEELRRSQRHGYPMSFMMIDVDNFKIYNDTYGHPAGDEALKIVANCLRAALRSADVAARYGGEEFSILLPQTTLSEALNIAERIRKRVEMTAFPYAKVTVSLGIAAYSPQYETKQAIIEAADRALYEAKRSGRNCVKWSTNSNGNK